MASIRSIPESPLGATPSLPTPKQLLAALGFGIGMLTKANNRDPHTLVRTDIL